MRPELEVFDTGQLVLVHELVDEGLIDDPPLIQLCMGIPYGAPDDLGDAARAGRPPAARARCSRRSRSGACSSPTPRSRRSSAPTCASASRTTCTSRAGGWRRTPSWWQRAVALLDAMNVRVLGPDEVRERLRALV